ncbi:prepilin-type N-terminal cleavage/methylation domain-containing protein [Thioflavicoccus mobilis 8321]|uniref:Prepilin-type N-terminal cleavage/methylation domain-containing protein n=1 Tax=Thioflavicoccus mobilis 8321 TaxID=765912 RepID=L0H2M6_9GAMM|nr:type IV pilin protein [Thioflavicoccus mobilis]AGA91844.1 prepilin-type N-terminal cleavage/methylation domain-containing protein [Thioflavicoccus mobilis 8321]
MRANCLRARGFTLIELMITVAIVGILAAIAYPSYQDSVRKSWRANAASCLLELAQGMERWYTGRSTYVGATVPTTGCTTEGGMGGRYDFSFTANPTATAFTLQAVPDTAGPQASDDCGTLTINQLGQKGASGGTVSECWRR